MIINKFLQKISKYFHYGFMIYCLSCSVNNQINQKDDYVKELEKEIPKDEYEYYSHSIFADHVKSVKLGTKIIATGEPCYQINSNDFIKIDFDLMNANIESIQYELIHCDKDWQRSNLMEMEYIDGFTVNYIENNDISYGPVKQYIHYSFQLPNENLTFLKSGNYIIKVYYEDQSENPLMTLKIFVSEQSSTVNFNLIESNNMEQRKYLQSYNLECTFEPNNIEDPYSNIFINIQQNHQEFDEHWKSGPNFIRENKLIFLENEEDYFNGSNEFRFFDISSFRNGSQKVLKTYFEDSSYKVILKKEPKRSYKQYLEYKDLDGKYFIRTYDFDQASFQAEYGEVYFELPMRKINNEKIYVFGQLSNWQVDERFQMKYDTISNSYKLQTLLKQGYYNYLYVTNNSRTTSSRTLEGAHFETNNEYLIKVYYRDPLELFDRILSYQIFK
ncbi:MAG: type IX secretion system plug protein domain-containing protein [Parvicellaceae bacterium]